MQGTCALAALLLLLSCCPFCCVWGFPPTAAASLSLPNCPNCLSACSQLCSHLLPYYQFSALPKCVSTCSQLCRDTSAVSQLFISCFSTVSQLFLNCFSTVSQLFLNCFSTVSQLFLNCFSTVSQMCLNCFSTASQLCQRQALNTLWIVPSSFSAVFPAASQPLLNSFPIFPTSSQQGYQLLFHSVVSCFSTLSLSHWLFLNCSQLFINSLPASSH